MGTNALRKDLARLNWFLSNQVGIDIRKLLFLPFGISRYISSYLRFRALGPERVRLLPCINDWREQAGAVESEYFWQDLKVAQMIYHANPKKHVDVGSRLDGFVAHVASFRPIEVFDIRPLALIIPNVTFQRADMMSPIDNKSDYADSVSCLHAIEHFGLGRYGDPLRLDGLELGISNLSKLLKAGGILYLSCPVGTDEIYFNAHRATKPTTVLKVAEKHGLEMEQCWLFSPHSRSFIGPIDRTGLENNSRTDDHSLALFTFRNQRERLAEDAH